MTCEGDSACPVGGGWIGGGGRGRDVGVAREVEPLRRQTDQATFWSKLEGNSCTVYEKEKEPPFFKAAALDGVWRGDCYYGDASFSAVYLWIGSNFLPATKKRWRLLHFRMNSLGDRNVWGGAGGVV